MVILKVNLTFDPNDALFFNATDDNIKSKLIDTLEYEYDGEEIIEAVNDSNVEDKERVISYLTSLDASQLADACRVSMDSLFFNYFEAENLIVYTIKLYFDETDIM